MKQTYRVVGGRQRKAEKYNVGVSDMSLSLFVCLCFSSSVSLFIHSGVNFNN